MQHGSKDVPMPPFAPHRCKDNDQNGVLEGLSSQSRTCFRLYRDIAVSMLMLAWSSSCSKRYLSQHSSRA